MNCRERPEYPVRSFIPPRPNALHVPTGHSLWNVWNDRLQRWKPQYG
ncbi:hypothetical protein [uncultured Bacteroides sp.]|nr:hypothetical protein [uncultured Bacteroides sp.]MDE6173423.1 hypothetical protein [Bacteroides sp.]